MILLPDDPPLDVLRRNKACPLLLAIGVLQRSPYLARFGWQGACWGSVCVAKVILLAETKTTRQGDGCEELAIHGWFPPFWAIFGCKSQPVDGRHQKEIRMEASWTIVWTCDLLYINWLAHFVHQHYVLTVGGGGGRDSCSKLLSVESQRCDDFPAGRHFQVSAVVGFCRFSYLERKVVVVVVQGVLVLKIKPIIWFYLAYMITCK